MASDSAQLEIEIVLPDGTIKKAFGKIKQEASKSGKESGQAFGSGFKTAASVFLGSVATVAFYKSMAAIKGEITKVVDAAKNLEVYKTQFATILNSSKAAEKQIASLQNFAASTPFQLPGLALATRQLLSFEVAQKDIIPTLTQLGDIAAGAGARIDELTIPYGRLVNTQKLTLVELDKFSDRGVNLFGRLAKQTGISLKNIRDEISKGRVPFKEFQIALNDLTKEGGLFAGGMQKLSRTYAGLVSTLSDNTDQFRANIGRIATPLLKAGLSTVIGYMQGVNKGLSKSFDSKRIDEFNRSLIGTAFTVNEYVLIPLKKIGDGFSFVFNGIRTGVQFALIPFTRNLGMIGQVMESLGQKNGLSQALRDIGTTGDEVLSEFSTKWKNSFEALTTDENGIEPFLNKLSSAYDQFAASVERANDRINKSNSKQTTDTKNNFSSVNSSLNGTVKSGIVNTIAFMGKSLVTGGNFWEGFLGTVVNAIGDLLIALGTGAITTGTVAESMQKAIVTLFGGQAIVAGVASIATGSALKAYASTLGAGGGSSANLTTASGGDTGGFANSPGSSFSSNETVVTEEERREPTNTVNVNIHGFVGNSKEETTFAIVDAIKELRINNGVTV